MAPRPPKQARKGATKAPQKPTPSASALAPYPPRIEGETPTAYAALCTYLAAGPDRNLRGVFPGGRYTPAKTWSARNGWQARAAAWDAAVRDVRLAALQERQRETDLATAEADARLSAAAAAVLFSDDEPTAKGYGLLLDLWRIGRGGADGARVSAVQTLVDLAGIKDLRKLRHHKATAPAPPAPPPALLTPDIIAALDAAASDSQLDRLDDAPLVDDPPEGAADASG